MSKIAIVLGSSRGDGHTRQLCNYLLESVDAHLIDLNTKSIGHFDYNFENKNDDFLPTITELINNYDLLIFATPVYWYSMSGTLKDFFDRITDLLKNHKNLARKLKGISMAVLSCSSGEDLDDSFALPFIKSAEYLDMKFISHCHGWIENNEIPEEVQKRIDIFSTQLK